MHRKTIAGRLLIAGFVALLSAFCGIASADEALLRDATNKIKAAEADLDAAKRSAGTAANPAKGSRVKLTRMRVESATTRLAEAGAILEKLQAGDAVAALVTRHKAATKLAADIEAILSEGAAPKKTPAPAGGGTKKPAAAPKADPKTPKLHYTEEKTLKDARWHLGEVDRYGAKVAAVVSRVDGQGEPAVHADVKGALELLGRAWDKFKLADNNLKQLPADHPQVAPVVQSAAEAKAALGALDSRLKAEHARLDKLTNMIHYPKYDEDSKKVQDFTRRYYDFSLTSQDPEKLAHLITEDGVVLEEIQRIAKLYLPLVEQRTDPGERMENLFKHFQSKRNRFSEQLMAFKAELPAKFESDLAEAEKLAKEGVEKNRPAYFGEHSGIAQRFGWAEDRVRILVAFDPEAAKPFQARLAKARADMKERAKVLEADIIKQNALPPDAYTGGDRAELIKIAKGAWAKLQPDAKVLAVRIPSQAWKRDTRWQHSGELNFYKIDSSSVQVQLLIQHDAKLAVVRPINLYKNHLANDTIKASPMDAVKDELPPHRFLLLEKITK